MSFYNESHYTFTEPSFDSSLTLTRSCIPIFQGGSEAATTINVQSVENFPYPDVLWKPTIGLIPENAHLSVKYVKRASQQKEI